MERNVATEGIIVFGRSLAVGLALVFVFGADLMRKFVVLDLAYRTSIA